MVFLFLAVSIAPALLFVWAMIRINDVVGPMPLPEAQQKTALDERFAEESGRGGTN